MGAHQLRQADARRLYAASWAELNVSIGQGRDVSVQRVNPESIVLTEQ